MVHDSQNRAALVTGAGTGIGRAIARRLAADGARVAIVGRRIEPLEETRQLIERDGGDCVVRTLDVTDAAAVAAGVAALAEQLGGSLHVLVNNAGVGGPNACSEDGPDRWDQIVRTNLDGVFFCTRETLRFMPEGGRVINISSVLGRFGVPGYTAYCTSKHGVIGFTKALALELAPRKITANAICPGWVETEMAREGMQLIAEATGVDYEQARRDALGMVPIGRILQPEEIAGLVAYLASDEAAGMTAQAVSLCGGSTMV